MRNVSCLGFALLVATLTPATADACHSVYAAPLVKMGILNNDRFFGGGVLWLDHQHGGMHCSAGNYELDCQLYDPHLVHLNYRGTDYFFAAPAGVPMQLDMRHGELNCTTG